MGAVALQQVNATLATVGNTLHDFAKSCAPCPQQESSPERRARAAELLQANETHLSVDALVALLDLFQAETEYADTYLTIKRDDLCKVWITKRLQNMAIPEGSNEMA